VTERPQLVVITGMSGAGRSLASKALEDLGFYVIDNLPANLIAAVVDQADLPGSHRRRLAVVVDARGGLTFADLEQVLLALGRDGVQATLVFLDADDETLLTRYGESRRPHPVDAPTLSESIALERELLADLRTRAEVVIDTTGRTVHELRDRIHEVFAGEAPRRPLRVGVTSFGFKHGVPAGVDLLFDVRFLHNPHWDEELRPLSGLDEPVREFVFSHADAAQFLEHVQGLLAFLLPRYEQEGKSYLTIGIGCTGGRHRSVAISEALGTWLGEKGIAATVRHRDVPR
jgi:UPF0042 nucleotide-binding protein